MRIFLFITMLIVLQRLSELVIAKRNERWMIEHGGVVVGMSHYKWFIIMHVVFFIALFTEVAVLYVKETLIDFNIYFFIIFLVAQIGRIWCITSLGKFWNTKIIVLPKVACIKKGPYKYVNHPNYMIVFVELFVIPAMFGAYKTASIFPLLHVLLLLIRIPLEDQALKRET